MWRGDPERLAEDLPTLAGVDHDFSSPMRYSRSMAPDWHRPEFALDQNACGRIVVIVNP
jgi:hypothetical protein